MNLSVIIVIRTIAVIDKRYNTLEMVIEKTFSKLGIHRMDR